MTATRLNRFLARRGVASRRSADRLIGTGRVTVNGSPAGVGHAVDPERDRVEVDGVPVAAEVHIQTLMLNKPAGVVTAVRDPHGRPTVMSLLRGRPAPAPGVDGAPDAAPRGAVTPAPSRPRPHLPGMVPVGRLDADSRGLLLLSSDGDLTHRLTHPRYGVTKRYRLTLAQPASDADLGRLAAGVELEDGWARVLTARHPDPSEPRVVEVEMGEGRKREVRRLCAALGLEVRDLVRLAVGPLQLGTLPEGRWRLLTPGELQALHACVQEPAAGAPGAG